MVVPRSWRVERTRMDVSLVAPPRQLSVYLPRHILHLHPKIWSYPIKIALCSRYVCFLRCSGSHPIDLAPDLDQETPQMHPIRMPFCQSQIPYRFLLWNLSLFCISRLRQNPDCWPYTVSEYAPSATVIDEQKKRTF
jgi:hypothetical protein